LKSLYPNRDFREGWRVAAEFSCEARNLNLLIDAEFPYNQPRVALDDKAAFLTWPHVEEDGVLCLGADRKHRDCVGQTQRALSAAHKLVSKSIAGETRADFQDEFLSYWGRHPGTKGVRFISLVTPEGPSRKIAVWRGVQAFIFAENEGDLRKWLLNRFTSWKTPPSIEGAALLWLPEPLFPEEYPKTASQIWNLAKAPKGEGRGILRDLTGKSQNEVPILIGAQTKHGPCLAGVTVSSPRKTLPGKRGSTIENGFRKGHVPASIIAERYWSASSPIVRSEVSRADASWVHGRGRDVNQERLSGSTVILIGCGSLGAPVAIQLAMAGVGNLITIDPEKLTYANVGRHPLGASHVDQYKSEALAAELKQNYPHHQFAFRNEKWQDVSMREPKLFGGASLIVCATGDWDTEDALNTWHLGCGRTPQIVYGWTEEHASAGHAVLISSGDDSSCLACGLDDEGFPILRLTSWPSDMLQQEPGCGALYQPYGPVELAHTTSLVSELALDALLATESHSAHRIWASRSSFLESAGGKWTPDWLALCSERKQGGFFFQRAWARNPQCASCGPSPTHLCSATL
jgi:molybdopterin/thiamine biosynthesis adenylyltransferase